MPGKKGRSGRKGAGREFVDFEKLWEQWSDPKAMTALLKKHEAKVQLSLQEAFLVRGYLGLKERDVAIFKKLFRDTNCVEGPDGGPLIVTWEE